MFLNALSKISSRFHGRLILGSRAQALAQMIAPLIQGTESLIDVGCGSGAIARAVVDICPHLEVHGFDILKRSGLTQIPTTIFDGKRLPLENESVDIAMAIDVLHHAKDPESLLTELCRVARKAIIIKDHRISRPGARPVLFFMDWFGNAGTDVELAGIYWSEEQWKRAWASRGLAICDYKTNLGLYPRVFRPLFEWGLHFLVKLEKHPAETSHV